MGALDSVPGVIDAFCSGSGWPSKIIRASIVAHGNVLYSIFEDKYYPVTIKLSNNIYLINEGCGIKTRGTLEQHIKYLEKSLERIQPPVEKFLVVMQPVDYPGLYPDLLTGANSIPNIEAEISDRLSKNKLVPVNGMTISECNLHEISITEDIEKIETLQQFRKEFDNNTDYNALKELMCIDEILQDAIKTGKVDMERYARIMETYNSIEKEVEDAEQLIKTLIQI